MNEQQIQQKIQDKIRSIPDFPKPGILFKDITTAIKDPQALALIIDWFYDRLKDKQIDYVVGLESRGFIFAPTLAYKLNAGFVPIRKPGKLPAQTAKVSYDLEYGSDSLEIHQDAIEKGKKVVVVDDLLATGGTAAAACELVAQLGGTVEAIAFLLELSSLGGREKLPHKPEIFSLISY